jgi:Icc-related predicted phosphoesterase
MRFAERGYLPPAGNGDDTMRIVYVTDIHDAFTPLAELIDKTDANLYLIGGDLVYAIFPTQAKFWEFINIRQYLLRTARADDEGRSLYERAQATASTASGDAGEEYRRKSAAYIALCDEAERRLLVKYEKLAAIFSAFPGKHFAVIPGNYDMDLCDTALRGWDIHRKSLHCGGMIIAGYGGARVVMDFVPDHLGVRFDEKNEKNGLSSEPYRFFKKERPEILLIHHPPYGFLDTLPGHGSIGSPGIRKYIDEEAPKVVFSGHIHEMWGCLYSRGTFFLNPSNFGRFAEVSQIKKGGYFFDLIVEEGEFSVATLRKQEGRRIVDLADYVPRDGELGKVILDEPGIKRLSSQAPRENHIRVISRFNRVKKFFLGHETAASKHMIEELRGIYRDMGKRGIGIAFDLLGSLNFGIAEQGSDIDLIVYLRGEECRPDPNDACSVPPPLQMVFDELRNRHLEIEVCDSLDLDRIEKALRAGDADDGHLQRFAFYRAICRPVNLRLIKEVENLLLYRPALRKKLETTVREYIRIMISSVRHIYSFKKYESRLIEKGIRMPEEIADLLRRYLKEA